METMFEYCGFTITMDGKVFTLPHKIQKAFALADVIVVLYQLDKNNSVVENNIVGYSHKGEHIWTVEDPKIKYNLNYEREDMDKKLKEIYVDIQPQSDDSILGSTFFSVVYTIDVRTGQIMGKTNNRW